MTATSKRLTVGSLFAGIGGFDLAAERVGWEVKWQVEIDDYATRVLEKHWPHVRRYRDVRAIDWSEVEPVDLVCGGFPCQPHSTAGRRMGAADERDLWPEFRRVIRDLRPRWVVAENVSGLLSNDAGRFFGGVLRDLAESWYRVEWDCIPAAAVGAPHRRDRVWIVAHAADNLRRSYRRGMDASEREIPSKARDRLLWRGNRRAKHDGPSACRAVVAHANSARPQERFVFAGIPGETRRDDDRQDATLDSWWAVEPSVGRVAHGVPARVDRLRGLGNAIVPQVAEWIFRQIQAAEESAA